MTIGEKLKNLRISLKLTQEELADAVGTKKQTIHKYETGIISNIPASKIKALADKLDTTPAYLMGWTEASATEYKKADTISDIIIKIRSDDELLEIMKDVCNLSGEQRVVVKTLLSAFNKDSE
jgi:transcriptional regulator with XRE-family HTH domain